MHKTMVITMALVSATLAPAARGQDSARLIEIHKKAAGALVIVRCTYTGGTTDQPVAGLGVCIRTDENQHGTFVMLMLDPKAQENYKKFELIIPGSGGKTLKAELLGIDPETGLGFVRATEKHAWSVIQFAPAANVQVGQMVVSVGALGANLGHPTCLGTARVSALVRAPGRLAYVSGGKLTGIGSPVFTTDGRAIGMVGYEQLYLTFETLTNRGAIPWPMKGLQETSFFTPAEEFAYSLKNIPKPGEKRRLRWIGVLGFESVSRRIAELHSLKQPGVRVARVVPTSPAAKAGLVDRDIIIGLDGQPIEVLPTETLTAQNFARKLHRMPAGKKVTLTIFRNNATLKATVQLEPMPIIPAEARRHFSTPLGMGYREKVPLDRLLDKTAAAKVDGLLVTRLQRNGPAHRAGVNIGDLVTGINEQKVATIAQANKVVQEALEGKTKATISLLVQRGEKVSQIDIKLQR